MDIVRFKGGLGNQMFQYAFLKSLSQRGRDVRGNLGFYRKHPELMQFCLTSVFPNTDMRFTGDEIFDELDERWKKIKEQKETLKRYLSNYADKFFWVENPVRKYDERVFETNNCVFVGYWQTEKYFKNIRDMLLSDFSFMCGDTKFEKLKNELISNEKYVSVHIRRGDYLKNPERYGNLAETNYYRAAMEYVKAEVDKPIFVYFSDDIRWVKEQFCDVGGIFIEEAMFDDYPIWYDMCLMSYCAHNIIANSSYSWWGAWLNQRINRKVIAPEPWFYSVEHEMTDICPDDWIRVNGEGMLYSDKENSGLASLYDR